MIGKIVKIEDLNYNIKSFWFKPSGQFSYLPGQYTDVELGVGNNTNWYTLSSSPTEDLCCFTTKFPEPMSEYKKRLLSLEPGDEINFSEVIGDYVLPIDSGRPLLFVAGGIGITPVRSIVKYLSDKNEKRKITLVYAAKSDNDLIFDDLFKSYGLKYIPILTNPSESWGGKVGGLTIEKLKELVGNIDSSTMAFISGPQKLVEDLTYALEKDLDRSQIVMDYFPGYTTI